MITETNYYNNLFKAFNQAKMPNIFYQFLKYDFSS